MPAQHRSFGDWINDRLHEAPGEQFTKNKWKFWFVVVAGFALINSALTALVFNTAGNLQQHMAAILLGVGALVAWLCVAGLHYSDGPDRKLARGVAALDSCALLFVVIHFSFLVWIYGHLITLQNAEAEYKAAAEAYNEKAEKVSTDNVAIAASAERIAQETTKAERLKNDAAYQLRKAAEAGMTAARSSAKAEIAPSSGLQTSQVELERPTKPAESSAVFLSKWDAAIRLANLAELLLACLTLILIRNRSAQTNSPIYDTAEEFPAELDAQTVAPRRRGNLTQKKDTAKTHVSYHSEGLKILRGVLRDISFRLHKRSFKVDIKGDAVFVRMVRARHMTQETIATAKAELSILADAVRMERTAFRERLEKFLRANGFEI